MRRTKTGIPLAFALAAALGGCSRDVYAERVKSPGVEKEPEGRPDYLDAKAWFFFPEDGGVVGSGAADLAEFCAKVSGAPRAGSVGCLPLVMYDSDHAGPWVSELGVALADEAAAGLRARGFPGAVLDTTDMAIRLSEVNLDKVSLTTAEAVAGAGDRLGVDVVVFGTMKREKDPGTPFLQRIRVDLAAYSFVAGALVGRSRMDLRSDTKENTRAYTAARNESLWMPGTEWNVPSGTKAFDEELRIVAGILARRAVQNLKILDEIKGTVYIPPADTGRFVRSIARLRAAQSAFALEYERRAKEAAKGESPLDIEMPVTLNAVEFKNLQAAYSYLTTLREQLLSTETARFASTVSSICAEAIRPAVSPRTVILDAGFTKGSDTQLLEGELATGGLARSLRARTALREQGIELIVAPKIEKVGSNYALRAEVYDLRTPNLVASASVRIEARYAAELAQQLEVDEMAAIEDLPAVEKNAWEKVHEKVVSGVVVLTGKQGEGGVQGTGFVVSPEGLVMTNSHVASAMEPGSGQATFAGGKTAAFRVVKDDPFWDLALVKVEGIPEGTHVFRFADAGRARVGAEVAVLGNPKGTQGWVLSPGHLSSTHERVQTTGERPSLMYTCATRGGNSGSPVLLQDGSVVAVHSAGMIGDVKERNGYQLVTDKGTVFSELTGFALGAPSAEAQKLLAGVGAGSR